MFSVSRLIVAAMLLVTALVCVSCLTMAVPRTAKVDGMPPAAGPPGADTMDRRLIDTWELMYQVNDEGREERPRESTRTLIEFTDKGRVVFNRVDPKNSRRLKSRSGDYSLAKNEIRITDDVGNSVRWPYHITKEILVIVMPEEKKKFFWRRFR